MPSGKVILSGHKGSRRIFSKQYIDQLFTLWYSMGKPPVRRFMPKIPPDDTAGGIIPEAATVAKWILSDFQERAKVLDAQVMEQINQRLIAEKVEMLNRHAEVGLVMQNMALEYLREHKEDLGITPAVRLLVAGVEIERQSRGIATTVEKITRMSDAELDEEIQRLIGRTPVTFEPLESGEELEDADISSR